ncbi:MAG: glycosyltransferase family 4 protein [Candidatus Dependentiae bacterium]|nr:glycosyltransferase family 4 protein [Candidatus Dependentiae bacterium]
MKLLLVIDDYLPDSTRVGAKMMHELAIELQRLGHSPLVVTPDCNQTVLLHRELFDGIQILRFRSGAIKDTSKLKRAFNESLLSIRAWHAIAAVIKTEEIDGVIFYSPSIFFGSLVSKVKKIWNCPSFLILRDIFPQWVIDQGMLGEKSLIARYFRHFEAKTYAAADSIGLMSHKNMDLFRQYYPDINNVSVLYNWTSLDSSEASCNIHDFRKQFGLEGKVIFFYGGNIGSAQDIPNLLRLALKFKNHSTAYFLFVGQGDQVVHVKNFIEQTDMKNIKFLPSVPQDEFKQLLKIANIGLFSLSATHKSHNFPGKLLGYMVNSIPILGSVNKGNDLVEVINDAEAGYVIENGKDNDLFHAANELLESECNRTFMGDNARILAEKKFSVLSAATAICQQLEMISVVSAPRRE